LNCQKSIKKLKNSYILTSKFANFLQLLVVLGPRPYGFRAQVQHLVWPRAQPGEDKGVKTPPPPFSQVKVEKKRY